MTAILIIALLISQQPKDQSTQEVLDTARAAKLDALIEAITTQDIDGLRRVLDDARNTVSRDDAKSILENIHARWGDVVLTHSPTPKAEAKQRKAPSKGDMIVVASRQFEATHIGRFRTGHGSRTGNRELRVYLFFPKSHARIGGFLAAEFPEL